MVEIEELLRNRLRELGSSYEPAPDLPGRINDLIERGALSGDRPPRSARRTRRRPWATGFAMVVVVVVVILVALTYGPHSAVPGGGSKPTSGARPTSQSTDRLRRALRIWSAFPVNASPRPLILLNGQVDAPANGFSGDETKIAFGDGAINAPATYPAGPAKADGYPLMSAQAAFGFFLSTAGKGPPATVDLDVTSMRIGTAVFLTDRGYLTLPAWLFSLGGVQDPAAVLAVAPAAVYSAPGLSTNPPTANMGVRLSPNGRTLTVTFAGAPSGTGPCDLEYSLVRAVSKVGVALQVNGRQAHPDRVANCAMPASADHIVTVLSAPLGNRVVIDAENGAPVSVTGAATDRSIR
jgi:hypothetical protein